MFGIAHDGRHAVNSHPAILGEQGRVGCKQVAAFAGFGGDGSYQSAGALYFLQHVFVFRASMIDQDGDLLTVHGPNHRGGETFFRQDGGDAAIRPEIGWTAIRARNEVSQQTKLAERLDAFVRKAISGIDVGGPGAQRLPARGDSELNGIDFANRGHRDDLTFRFKK